MCLNPVLGCFYLKLILFHILHVYIYINNVIKCKCYTVVLRLDMNLSPVSEMRVSHVKAFVDGSGKEGGIC